MITRRTALVTLFTPAVLLAARPRGAWAQAKALSLATLSNYLNRLTTVEADFTQVNGDDSISTGRIYIRRPGRIRFEYAPPDRALVLASSGEVAIFDAKSNQPPEQYPLSKTPLNLILGANIDLARTGMVVAHRADGTSTRVTAQDPAHPDYGTIELVFTDQPVELRQWIITDDLGQKTTVILGEMTAGKSYPASMFSISREIERRGRR